MREGKSEMKGGRGEGRRGKERRRKREIWVKHEYRLMYSGSCTKINEKAKIFSLSLWLYLIWKV